PLRGQTSLTPVLLRRPSGTGLPWPDPDFRGIPAAHLLRNTCARPSVRGVGHRVAWTIFGFRWYPSMDALRPADAERCHGFATRSVGAINSLSLCSRIAARTWRKPGQTSLTLVQPARLGSSACGGQGCAVVHPTGCVLTRSMGARPPYRRP